jgi:hypothetical protein
MQCCKALLSVGDRRTAELARLVDREGMSAPGCMLGNATAILTSRARDHSMKRCLDHIQTGVTRRYLIEQFEAALKAEVSATLLHPTAGCRLWRVC